MSRQAIRITPARRLVRWCFNSSLFALTFLWLVMCMAGGVLLLWALFAVALGAGQW